MKTLMLAVCLLLTCCLLNSVFAIQNGNGQHNNQNAAQNQSTQNSEDTIKVDATLVNIPATVSDDQGRYIPNLTANDFALYEENVKQQIAFFSADNVPFSLALVIDVSGSTRDSLTSIQQAASAFVNNLRTQDRMSVISFSNDLTLECDFTNDHTKLLRTINNIHSGRSTHLYDAIYATMNEQLKPINGRKAMILLTDGEDTQSQLDANQALLSAQEAGALVYVLQYPSSMGGQGHGNRRGGWDRFPRNVPNLPRWPHYNFAASPQYPQQGGQYPQQGGNGPYNRGGGNRQSRESRAAVADSFLRQIVDQTGGNLYHATAVNNMPSLASQIAEELRHVYTLGYYPTTPLEQHGYRHVKVALVNKQQLKLHYKQGYDAGNSSSATNQQPGFNNHQ